MGQGCQMVSFRTKNPNLEKFWRALDGKMLIHFRPIQNIVGIFGIFFDHLVHFSGFGVMKVRRKIWQPCHGGSGTARWQKRAAAGAKWTFHQIFQT
jgi:hypothetical protein